jgi:hypothetical protein
VTTLATRLRIDDWDESVLEEFDDGRKITRAAVRLRDGVDGLESGFASMLAFYRPDGTSDYVSMLYLSGRLDGHQGTVVFRGEGGYDGTTASSRMTVVAGSGTAGLDALRGRLVSESTSADYPFMPLTLTYQFG